MRKFLALAAVLALVAFAADAGAQQLISGTLSGYKISATATNTATTFPTTNGATTSLTIYNAGSNEVFVAVNAVATASSIEIPAGATLTLTDFTATSLGVICSTAETSTVYLYSTAR